MLRHETKEAEIGAYPHATPRDRPEKPVPPPRAAVTTAHHELGRMAPNIA